MARKVAAFLGVIVFIFFAFQKTGYSRTPERPLLNWLLKMQVPNEAVPSPAQGRGGLVLSYIVPLQIPNHAELFDRAYVYDNALAAIALTLCGEFEKAEAILSSLAGLMDEEGKLGLFYHTYSNGFEAAFRTGPNVWAGYAFVFYMRASRTEKFKGEARKIADWILNMQDAVLGSVRGGPDVTWFSTEDNIAAFFFLRDAGMFLKERSYLQAAGKIARSLLTNHWNRDYHCFQAGIQNRARHLRAASWGALFSLSLGQLQRAFACLRFIERNLRAEVTRRLGEEEISIFGYKPKAGEDVNFVWSEGSLGVALAHKRIRNKRKFVQIIKNMIKMRGVEGGIIYALPPVQRFPRWESTASVSWMLINSARHQWAFWRGMSRRQDQSTATPGSNSRGRNEASKSRQKGERIR